MKLTILQADVPNINGLVYPPEVLEKAVKEFNEKGKFPMVCNFLPPKAKVNGYVPAEPIFPTFTATSLSFDKETKKVELSFHMQQHDVARATETLLEAGILTVRPYGYCRMIPSTAVDPQVVSHYQFAGFCIYRINEVIQYDESTVPVTEE
jgi:hypothetical protein